MFILQRLNSWWRICALSTYTIFLTHLATGNKTIFLSKLWERVFSHLSKFVRIFLEEKCCGFWPSQNLVISVLLFLSFFFFFRLTTLLCCLFFFHRGFQWHSELRLQNSLKTTLTTKSVPMLVDEENYVFWQGEESVKIPCCCHHELLHDFLIFHLKNSECIINS